MSYYSLFVPAIVTFLLTNILLCSRVANKIQDIPNERSLHTAPVPRIGGMALIIGLLSGWAMNFHSLIWWIVLPLLMLFMVSLLDDLRGLSVRFRLFVHVSAAFLLALGCGLFVQSVLLGILVMFVAVWAINLYNFMDGSDGLAGGMALFGFSIYGIAAIISHEETFALLNFSIAAAAASFLYFNFYPAKVFMGDAGSIPLGFLAAAMGLWGWQMTLWPVWFPLMVFSPFVLDATVTLIKRGIRKEKIWQAHREHYYQRIVQLGLGHRNTAVLEYVLMASVGASALFALQFSEMKIYILLSWSAIYFLTMLLLDYCWKVKKNV